MDRHLLYIINPISGTRNKSSLRKLIEAKTNAAQLRYSIHLGCSDGNYHHLHSLVTEENITDIIIAGGDGTINGVVRSFKNFRLAFGILPCGSGNGLALGAHLPRDISKALEIVFKGRGEWTDAFEINGQFACMLCGLGFDAQVSHDFANDARRGLITYIRKALSHFFSAKAYPFTIRSGDEILKTEALFISIANSNQFGNNFTIAPRASLTDGLLDIVVVSKQAKLNVLLQTLRQVGGFNKLYTENITESKAGVLYFQTDALNIQNHGRAPLHIDGDPVETAENFDIKILKNCFRLIYP